VWQQDSSFAGHSNCSVSFQLAQLKVGEGKVPESIVLYFDGTFLMKGIPIRSGNLTCIYIVQNIVPNVIAGIIPDISYCLFRKSVVTIMADLQCPSRIECCRFKKVILRYNFFISFPIILIMFTLFRFIIIIFSNFFNVLMTI
jgi:hypothetical protein